MIRLKGAVTFETSPYRTGLAADRGPAARGAYDAEARAGDRRTGRVPPCLAASALPLPRSGHRPARRRAGRRLSRRRHLRRLDLPRPLGAYRRRGPPGRIDDLAE